MLTNTTPVKRLVLSAAMAVSLVLTANAQTWTGGGVDDSIATQGNWNTTFNNTGTGFVGFTTSATIGNATVNTTGDEFRIGGTNQALILSENVEFTMAGSGFQLRTTGNLTVGTTSAGGNVVNFNSGTALINGGINTTAAVAGGNPLHEINFNGGVVAWNGAGAVGWGNSNQVWASNGGSTIWLVSGSGGNFQLNNSIALNSGNLTLRNDTNNRIYIIQGGFTGTGSISTFSGANPGGVIQFSGTYASSGSVTVGADTELRMAAADRVVGAGQGAAFIVNGLMNLNAAGRSQTIGALSGNGEVRIIAGAGTTYLEANSNGSTSTFNGQFTNNGELRVNASGANLTLSGNSSAFTGNMIVGGGGTITVGNANYIGSGTTFINAGGTLNLNAIDVGSKAISMGGANALLANNGTGTAIHTGNIALTAAGAQVGGSNTLLLGGVISGDHGIEKVGGNTVQFQAVNTYTGDTTITGGTLVINASGGLTFVIGSNGVNNQITGDGNLTALGRFVFDLSSASTNIGDTWTVVATTNAPIYSGFTPFAGSNAFTDLTGGLWEYDNSGTVYQFNQSTGNLTVVPEPATYALLGGLMALGIALLRRRSKRS